MIFLPLREPREKTHLAASNAWHNKKSKFGQIYEAFDQMFGKRTKFSRRHFTFFTHMLPLWKKNVQFYYCHSIEWCIVVERMRELKLKKKCNIFCICRIHLSREIRHSNQGLLMHSFVFLLPFNDCSSITI